MSKLQSELSRIQRELKAPKGQFNAFGKYKYRSCEDILEGLKKVLGDCTITLSDDIILVGADRYYVKASASLFYGDEVISVTAMARESLNKKGQDESQITGTASSYARKYALNGLFAIDDTKDADTMNNSHQRPPTSPQNGDYKKRVAIIERINAVCKVVGEGMDKTQKMALMKDVLKVGNFGELSKKQPSELESILSELEVLKSEGE